MNLRGVVLRQEKHLNSREVYEDAQRKRIGTAANGQYRTRGRGGQYGQGPGTASRDYTG